MRGCEDAQPCLGVVEDRRIGHRKWSGLFGASLSPDVLQRLKKHIHLQSFLNQTSGVFILN